MSASYEGEWLARFGDETDVPRDVPEVPWLRQVLLRRTHRRYADRPVAEPLLRLLLAAAVAAYDVRRDARYSIPREQQRLPEIFGYASLFGWSEDNARQAARPEGQDFPAYRRARDFSME
jgi:hypothetical protein